MNLKNQINTIAGGGNNTQRFGDIKRNNNQGSQGSIEMSTINNPVTMRESHHGERNRKRGGQVNQSALIS